MSRKVFEIVLVIVGIILGSLASLHGNIIPTSVKVITNQDVQVKIKQNGAKVSDIEIGDLDILPIHYEDGKYYYSATLSMDDLVQGHNGNYYQNVYDVSLTKQTDNAYLQVEFNVEGEDAINDALRLRVKYLTNEWVLSKGESIIVDSNKMTTSDMSIVLTLWYELSDPSCTIENINAATGSSYSIDLYAYVTE